MPRVLLMSALAVSIAACAPRVTRPAAPVEVHANVSKYSRVWIAGFVTTRNPEVDVNLETVRFLRTELRASSSAAVVDADPVVIENEQKFADKTYWRTIGEELGGPLIVTGTVKLLLAPPAVVQRGPRTAYIPTAGRVLEATVVLIDGRTGDTLSTRPLPTRVRYGLGRLASGLSLYFQLMERALPDWVMAIGGK